METWKEREWRMSCPKIRALLSQHWRHSAHCDCLGSCWRNSLNEDCQHARKRFWHCPVLLSIKSTHASALSCWWEELASASVLCESIHMLRGWGQCWPFWTWLVSIIIVQDRCPPDWVHVCLGCYAEKTQTPEEIWHAAWQLWWWSWRKLSTLGKRWDTAPRGLSKLSSSPYINSDDNS